MPSETPIPISHKFGLGALFLLGFLVCYVYPNFYPRFSPSLLPLTRVDLLTPFLPWTFLIYFSDYPYVALPALFLVRRDAFYRYVRQMFAVLYLCGLAFLFYPTTYPRPSYPAAANALLEASMQLIATADRPNNCFPSMHVALTLVAAFNLRGQRKRHRLFFAMWAFAICVSTLTTKQHYLLDVIGGAMVAMLIEWSDALWIQPASAWVLKGRRRKKFPPPSDRRKAG